LHSATLRRLAASTALALIGAATLAQAAPPPPPPASDGSSGSFSAQINTNFDRLFTDSGLALGCGQTYCAYSANIPFTTVKYGGQMLNVYNFTDINLPAGQTITLYGSKPALFLASQGIAIAGKFVVLNGGGAPGMNAPNTPTAPGGMGGGKGGGAGGGGQGGETVICGCCTGGFTGGGGGGGGNISTGQPGNTGFYPPSGPAPARNLPGGAGGINERAGMLQGGGGGAGGGGGNDQGNFFTTMGGQGGGAIVFGSSGTFSVLAGGTIDVMGLPGQTQGYTSGSGGGGAGGDVWLFASSTFTNAGIVTAQGALGGNNLFNDECGGPTNIPGPNGGNGSGGLVSIEAPTINNKAGIINVADGGGGTGTGGKVLLKGTVQGRGHIIGLAGH